MFGLSLIKAQLCVTLALLVLCSLICPHDGHPHTEDGGNSTEAGGSVDDGEDPELVDDGDDDDGWENEQDPEEEAATDNENDYPYHRFVCKRKTGRCKIDEDCCEPLICRRHIIHKKCK